MHIYFAFACLISKPERYVYFVLVIVWKVKPMALLCILMCIILWTRLILYTCMQNVGQQLQYDSYTYNILIHPRKVMKSRQ